MFTGDFLGFDPQPHGLSAKARRRQRGAFRIRRRQNLTLGYPSTGLHWSERCMACPWLPFVGGLGGLAQKPRWEVPKQSLVIGQSWFQHAFSREMYLGDGWGSAPCMGKA